MEASARLTGARVFLVDQNGRPLDWAMGEQPLTNHPLFPPEEGFLVGKPGSAETYLPVLGMDVLFVSIPVKEETSPVRAVVMVAPLVEIKRAQLPFLSLLLISSGISFLTALLVGLYLSSSISRPVHNLTEAADKVAAGDLDQMVKEDSKDEIGRLARTFNYMVEKVRRTYRAQRDFVSNVSHELRTPLTSIDGFSQALLDNVAKGGERRHALEVINKESKRLRRLVESLLTLSRIDAGQLDLRITSFDVGSFLSGIIEKLKFRAEEHRIKVILDVADDAGRLKSDPDRLEQVLTNLLDNALNYSSTGDRIWLRGFRKKLKEKEELRIEVQDEGEGIPAEELPHIFDRFHRVEKSRAKKFGGAGLGLSISKEITEALGGKISVQSEPGKGSTFTISLPL